MVGKNGVIKVSSGRGRGEVGVVVVSGNIRREIFFFFDGDVWNGQTKILE